MKKLGLSLMIILGLSSVASASYAYECSRYVKGDWKGYVKVLANSKDEAVKKAYAKYKKMDMRVDRINCK
jgi:hypothetical protein